MRYPDVIHVERDLEAPAQPRCFDMDGMTHEYGMRCCTPWECRVCGGRVHSEAIYGPSMVYLCEGCDYDESRAITSGVDQRTACE